MDLCKAVDGRVCLVGSALVAEQKELGLSVFIRSSKQLLGGSHRY